MPTVYYLKATNSDLTGGADYTKRLDTVTATAATLSVPLAPGGGNEDSFAFTPAGVPGAAGVTGNYTVEVDVTTAGASTTVQIAVARVNSAGTQQSISTFTATQSTATTGVKTFSLTGINLGTWAAGDRLKVIYRWRNTHTSQTKTPIIETGTTNTEVTAPWAAPVPLTPAGLGTSIFPGSVPPSDTPSQRTRGMGSTTSVEPPIVSQIRVSFFEFEIPRGGSNLTTVGLAHTRAQGAPVAHWALSTSPAALTRTRALGTAAVSGGTPKTTGTAQLSLAAVSEPQTRTNHVLVVQARKTNGAHSGKIRVQLFEDGIAVTGLLETGELTTSLANYTLPVTDLEAASIGAYTGLEVRITGYAQTGTATVFEVSEVWLQTPAALPSVEPGSVVHTRVFGTAPKVSPSVRPAALVHARALGPTKTSPKLVTTGTAHTRALGAPKVSPQTKPAGLVHTRAQGAQKVSPGVKPAGLAHTRALGTARLAITPAGLGHTRALGAPKLNPQAKPAGIAHTRAQGTVGLSMAGSASPGGLAHARAQGAPKVSPSAKPVGLTRTRALGTITVTPRTYLTPAALTHTRAQGAPKVNAQAKPAGLTHTRTLGTTSVTISGSASPASLSHARGQGALKVSPSTAPAGQTHTRAQGAATVSPKTAPASLTHTRGSSSPVITTARVVTPTGIVHTRAVGSQKVSPKLGPVGIAHTRVLGAPAVSPKLAVVSLTRTRALGVPALTLVRFVSPVGAAHTRGLGTVATSAHYYATPSGITHTRAQGAAKVNVRATFAAIVHTRTLGSPFVGQIIVAEVEVTDLNPVTVTAGTAAAGAGVLITTGGGTSVTINDA